MREFGWTLGEIRRLPKRKYDELLAILEWVDKQTKKKQMEAEAELRRMRV